MRTIVGIFGLLTVLAVAPGAAFAKSYSLDRFHSDVNVREDGSARVDEYLTYTFDGSFTYAFRNIPLRDTDSVYDVELAEADNAYAQSITETPGSYTVAIARDEAVITWHYRAKNETRTFRVSYTIEGASARHDDIGEFYLTLFDNQTGGSVGEVSTRISLPGDISPADMRVFAHGPLHGDVRTVAASTVTARVAPLHNGWSYDVRVLFPPDALAATASDGRARLEEILGQEAGWAEDANRRREAELERREAWRAKRERRSQLLRQFFPVAVLIGTLSLVMWFAYFRRHGWPHAVEVHASPGEPPSDLPPALISYLVARSVGGPALVATLVDLSERGHLKITETIREKTGWFGSSSSERDYRFERTRGRDAVHPFEQHLLDFALGEIGDGRSFTMSGFKKYAGKKRSKVRTWFVAWTKLVKDEGKRRNFFEPYDTGAVLVNVLVGVAVIGAGITISVVTSSPAGIPAIVGGALQALLTLTFTRHTPEARRQVLAWNRFRDHLKSVSKSIGKVSLTSHDWSRYLAVAIIFGMHKKLLPSMALADTRAHSGYPVWYGAMASVDGGVAGMADGLSTMISTVTTTMSSSTGSGGGASGGGGGGAGGGSAGAG